MLPSFDSMILTSGQFLHTAALMIILYHLTYWHPTFCHFNSTSVVLFFPLAPQRFCRTVIPTSFNLTVFLHSVCLPRPFIIWEHFHLTKKSNITNSESNYFVIFSRDKSWWANFRPPCINRFYSNCWKVLQLRLYFDYCWMYRSPLPLNHCFIMCSLV